MPSLHDVMLKMRERGRPMQRGDYEFVMGPDGLSHTIIMVDTNVDGTAYDWVIACGALMSTWTVKELQVSPHLTCMKCNGR